MNVKSKTCYRTKFDLEVSLWTPDIVHAGKKKSPRNNEQPGNNELYEFWDCGLQIPFFSTRN